MALIALLVGLALAGPAEDLQAAANSDLSEDSRMAAFDRLVDLGATSITVVRDVSLDDDSNARQRWVAVRVLGQVGGKEARSTLLTLIENDMPAMRAAAATALGDAGDRFVTTALIKCLDDEAVLVRAAAADALGKLRDPKAVPHLSRVLEDKASYYRGSSLWVRRHYIDALGLIGDPSALPVLMRSLHDTDSSVARGAITSLEEVAGFSYAEGRNEEEEREAWNRWATSQIGKGK